MPAPRNPACSFDSLIYNSFFPKCLCILHPNWVTTLGNIFTIITAISFYYNNIFGVIFFSFMRQLADSYDGMIARKCNKTTTFGHYYDMYSDLSYWLILLFISYYKSSSKYMLFKFVIIIFIIYIFVFPWIKPRGHSLYDRLIWFFHDNLIIVTPCITILLYILCMKFK